MRLALLAALLLGACDDGSVSEPPDFGDGYDVATDSATLDGGTLRVTVSYSGGCEEHTFIPQSRTVGATHELWLVHDANGDLCEAYPTEPLAVDVRFLPPGALVVLLTPADGEILLR